MAEPESSSAPTLFPLASCESPVSDESPVALGCLARDFLPDSITFSWSYPDGIAVSSQSIKTFPSVLREGKYVATSQVLLPSQSVLQGSELICKVQHSKGNSDVRVTPPVVLDLPPNVTLFMPPRDGFSGTSKRTSRLICQATDFSPREISVSWFREGKRLVSGFITEDVEASMSNPGTFSVNSMLTITESDWFSQTVYTCQVEHRGMVIEKNVSSQCNPSPSPGIEAFAIPPSFSDIFLNKSAKLTCLVTGLVTYDSLSISWTRQGEKAVDSQIIDSRILPNGTFSATCVASVCVEDWESGDRFTCTVTHLDLPSPLKRSIFKPTEVHKHMPSVYVLPPAREQLSLRESASITCLVKGFSPPDVFVQWLKKGEQEPLSPDNYVTSAPVPEPNSPGYYFVHSVLTVSEKDWSAGATYTCVVGHEALPHLVTERTVDKSTGKPTLYNVSLVMSDTASTCY